MQNDAYRGGLELNKNDLSDLSMLHLAPIFEKQTGQNIKSLKLDYNNFTSKTGEYIGGALCNNPNYQIKKISFEGICLESIGLVRILEAANQNKNIKKLNIGTITDAGLKVVADILRENTSLEELEFEETADHQKYWTDEGRGAFTETIKRYTELKKVNIVFERDEEDSNKEFRSEVKFYTKKKVQRQKKLEEYEETLESCNPAVM